MKILKYKKDNQREIIIIETIAWAFVIGSIYIFFKTTF